MPHIAALGRDRRPSPIGTGAILGDGEAVPLTAVPEPSTVAAGILVTIAMLGHLRRRRAS